MTDIPEDALVESWESVHTHSVKLAKLIREHCQDTGEKFDGIIVIPRGGYYPANIVARELGFEAVRLLNASVGSYKENETTRQSEFELGQMPSKADVQSKNLLIIDEVCDTGNTLDFLIKWLKEQGTGQVRSGVLHYKPEQSQTGYKPDWFVVQTDKWIVYPWESHEKPD